MNLAEFLYYFEENLQLPLIDIKAGNDEIRDYLNHDSERVYHGDISGEVKRVAFMVQPHRDLCQQAVNNGLPMSAKRA